MFDVLTPCIRINAIFVRRLNGSSFAPSFFRLVKLHKRHEKNTERGMAKMRVCKKNRKGAKIDKIDGQIGSQGQAETIRPENKIKR